MSKHKYSDDCSCDECNNTFNKTVFSNMTMEVQCDYCEVSYNGKLKMDETISEQWLKIKHKEGCIHKDKPFSHDYCRGGIKPTDNQLLYSDITFCGKENIERRKKLLKKSKR